MTTTEIPLFTPNGDRVIGIKLSDGSIGNIIYTVDSKKIITCTLPHGVSNNTGGTYTFIIEGEKEVIANLNSILDHSLNLWMGN